MDSAVSVPAEKLSHKEVFLPMKRSARMAAFLLAAALSAAPCLAEFTPVEVPQATNAPAAPEATENVPQITEKG